MKDCNFIDKLKAEFNKPTPTYFKIFKDIYSNRELAYCFWQTDNGIVSIDYSILNNEVKQIAVS